MRPITTRLLAALFASAIGCTVRERRPDGPYRQAEEFADVLSDHAVECVRQHAPDGATGSFVVAAEFTGANQAAVILDAGSVAGSEAVLDCIRARVAETLRSPAKAPARFVRIRVPLPLVTSKVTYAFTDSLPE